MEQIPPGAIYFRRWRSFVFAGGIQGIVNGSHLVPDGVGYWCYSPLSVSGMRKLRWCDLTIQWVILIRHVLVLRSKDMWSWPVGPEDCHCENRSISREKQEMN